MKQQRRAPPAASERTSRLAQGDQETGPGTTPSVMPKAAPQRITLAGRGRMSCLGQHGAARAGCNPANAKPAPRTARRSWPAPRTPARPPWPWPLPGTEVFPIPAGPRTSRPPPRSPGALEHIRHHAQLTGRAPKQESAPVMTPIVPPRPPPGRRPSPDVSAVAFASHLTGRRWAAGWSFLNRPRPVVPGGDRAQPRPMAPGMPQSNDRRPPAGAGP